MIKVMGVTPIETFMYGKTEFSREKTYIAYVTNRGGVVVKNDGQGYLFNEHHYSFRPEPPYFSSSFEVLIEHFVSNKKELNSYFNTESNSTSH